MKNQFTDRLEAALIQLSDCNTRYGNLLLKYDECHEKFRKTETELTLVI